MGLVEIGEQILDVLSALVTAPCRGIVAITGNTYLPPGTVGVLPNGRKVRVYQGGASSVRCRLLELHPTVPPGNFSGVAANSVVTWVHPPSGVGSTGTVQSTFAPSPRATLGITSVTTASRVDDGGDAFCDARAVGTVGIVVVSPTIKASPVGTIGDVQLDALWTLRVFSSSNDRNPTRTLQTQRIFDALTLVFQRVVIGDKPARIASWTPSRMGELEAWDMELHTTFSTDNDPNAETYPAFDEFSADINSGLVTTITTL